VPGRRPVRRASRLDPAGSGRIQSGRESERKRERGPVLGRPGPAAARQRPGGPPQPSHCPRSCRVPACRLRPAHQRAESPERACSRAHRGIGGRSAATVQVGRGEGITRARRPTGLRFRPAATAQEGAGRGCRPGAAGRGGGGQAGGGGGGRGGGGGVARGGGPAGRGVRRGGRGEAGGGGGGEGGGGGRGGGGQGGSPAG